MSLFFLLSVLLLSVCYLTPVFSHTQPNFHCGFYAKSYYLFLRLDAILLYLVVFLILDLEIALLWVAVYLLTSGLFTTSLYIVFYLGLFVVLNVFFLVDCISLL